MARIADAHYRHHRTVTAVRQWAHHATRKRRDHALALVATAHFRAMALRRGVLVWRRRRLVALGLHAFTALSAMRRVRAGFARWVAWGHTQRRVREFVAQREGAMARR